MDTEDDSLDSPAREWLVDLIAQHQDTLATTMLRAAQRRFPLYRAMEPDLIHPLFLAFYQVIAATLRQTDLAPLRLYLERVLAERIRQGASLTGYLELTNVSTDAIHALIIRETPADPQQAAAALHLLAVFDRVARRLVAEVLADPPPG